MPAAAVRRRCKTWKSAQSGGLFAYAPFFADASSPSAAAATSQRPGQPCTVASSTRPRWTRRPPRLGRVAVLTGPLATAHERVEGREDVERHEHRSRLEALAVIDRARRRQIVLQPPRQSDAVVVMRMARPARTRTPDDRFPETRHALGETVEGRAEADVVDEGQRARRASHAQAGRAAEAAGALRLQSAGW